MMPYTGIALPYIAVFVVAIMVALGALLYSFKLEKVEKSLGTQEAGKKRKIKYGVFSVFFIAAIGAVFMGSAMSGLSLKAHHSGVVNEISETAVISEGFVDPTIALTPNSIAKFVVETDSGLTRCRAIATESNIAIQYMCQDKDLEFTVPLKSLTS